MALLPLSLIFLFFSHGELKCVWSSTSGFIYSALFSSFLSFTFLISLKARCLTSVKKSTEKSKFLAGTVGAKENIVCLLEYDDDNALLSSFMFQHPQEVWDIASCPNDEDVFFTCHSSGTHIHSLCKKGNQQVCIACESPLKSKATLWRKPSVSIENQQQELIPLMTLDYEGAKKWVI